MNTIEKGVYVAHQGSKEVCIAMDEYSVSRIKSGFLVESNSSVFGVNGFLQKSVLRTNIKWQMQELLVSIESMMIEMCASVKDEKMYLQQKQQDMNVEKIIDLQNDKFFFLYSGALIIPMIWLRGFDFDNYEKVTYQMLPIGYAEIKQLSNSVSVNGMRDFSLLMYMHNFTDVVKVQTDMSGKLLFFHSETNQISIKLQSQ
jgi:hypothetical protein